MRGEHAGDNFFEAPLPPETLRPANRVAVLDAGGQYVDLVQKAVERLGFPANVLPLSTPFEHLSTDYAALIISGSPANSHETEAPMPDSRIWQSGKPILGICYGMQAMASMLGGTVERGPVRQDGRVKTGVNTAHPLFHNTKEEQVALFTHGNFVTELPAGFQAIGEHILGESIVYSAIARGNCVGVQFHPEVFDDTPEGYEIFKNFLGTIANLTPDEALMQAKLETIVTKKRQEIRAYAGNRVVYAFLSGGVDSAVAAALAAPEIAPAKFHSFYIDNGFMRDEDDSVIETLRAAGLAVEAINAADYFSGAGLRENGMTIGPLREIIDPQIKRRIIGKAFVQVKKDLEAHMGSSDVVLLQGTNAADRIESGNSKGGKETAVIKTHHNQVREIAELKKTNRLLEPLDDLFKDEIRALGRYLGLPDHIVDRHPFPGPGLAIRILCATGSEFYAPISDIESQIQSFLDIEFPSLHTFNAKVLPVRNVGVGGDERSHISPVAIQSTAPWESLSQLATDLPGKYRGLINRVIVPLGDSLLEAPTITPTSLDPEALRQSRQAHRIVYEEMERFGVMQLIKQCPVVLLPLAFGAEDTRSIVLRPVTTSTFMTVQAMVPGRDLPEEFFLSSAQRLMEEITDISQVFVDLTNKPPGTTEWE